MKDIGGTTAGPARAGIGQQPAAMLTVSEVAAILKCSTKTVYRLADAGKMPAACRLGDLVRWSSTAINEWIDAGCPACRKVGRRGR